MSDELDNEEVPTEALDAPAEAPETETVPEEKEKDSRPPTPEDSVLEAIQIARGDKVEKDGEAVEPTPGITRKRRALADAAEATEAEDSEPISPPQRLSAEGKEWFLKLPKQGQKEYANAITHLEGLATKTLQEARKAEGESKEVVDAIKPYITQWGLRGVTPAQAIRQLAAANQNLVEKREEGIVELCRVMKIDPKLIVAKLEGKKVDNGASDPRYDQLTKELEEHKLWRQRIESQQQEAQQQSIQQSAQGIAKEIDSVRNELNAQGKLKYPKLHDAQYLAQIEPLIFNLWQTHGGNLSWADATRRTVHAVEGTSPSPSPQDPRLSRTNKDDVQRAKAASVSVRGRGASPLLSLASKDIPRKAEDTVRMVLEQLNREG